MSKLLFFFSLFVFYFQATAAFPHEKDLKIAIIGAGVAGLTAAYQLDKHGYTNVVIYEKNPRPGGKVRTVTVNGDKIELGALFALSTYETIGRLAEEFEVELETFPAEMLVRRADGQQIRYKGYTGSGHLPTLLGSGNLKSALRRFPQIGEPSFANVPEKLFVPMSEFARRYGFESILSPYRLMLAGFGYGHTDEIPALYHFKLVDLLHSIGEEGYFDFRGETEGTKNPLMNGILIFPAGFQGLWNRIADRFNVSYDSEVTRIVRNHGQALENKILVGTAAGQDFFDRVIIATPLDVALTYLDASEKEQKWFSRIRYNRIVVTLFRSEDLDSGEATFVFVENDLESMRAGHLIAYTNYHADRNIFVGYQQPGLEVDPSRLRVLLETDVKAMGGTVSQFLGDTVEWWHYFPHFAKEDLEAGAHGEIESLQGINGTFYVGGIMNLETTETTAAYSIDLVKRFFPE